MVSTDESSLPQSLSHSFVHPPDLVVRGRDPCMGRLSSQPLACLALVTLTETPREHLCPLTWEEEVHWFGDTESHLTSGWWKA